MRFKLEEKFIRNYFKKVVIRLAQLDCLVIQIIHITFRLLETSKIIDIYY